MLKKVIKVVLTMLITLGIILAIGMALFYRPTAYPPVAKAVDPPAPTSASLLELVNAERAKNNAAPLVEDSRLDQSAQFKADDMHNRQYYSHVDPTTGRMNGLDMIISLTGQTCSYVSENLVEAYSSQQAMDEWISSPDHHAAMINAKYTLTGFGINGNKVVEHFCQLR